MIYSTDSPASNLQWLTTLDVENLPSRNYRRSSIIGTIGMYHHYHLKQNFFFFIKSITNYK